jgi:hypothetical protein
VGIVLEVSSGNERVEESCLDLEGIEHELISKIGVREHTFSI